MTFIDALTLCKAKRSKVNPNPGFVTQLKVYEEEILHNKND